MRNAAFALIEMPVVIVIIDVLATFPCISVASQQIWNGGSRRGFGAKWGMLGQTVAFVAVACLVSQTPKPPEATYDAQRDVTTYSTGDVHTAGSSGYGARFECPGKTLSAPSSIAIGFGALRLTHGRGPDQDQALLHWKEVKAISLTFGGKTQEYPAVHTFNVSTNRQATMFLGRALEEALSISLTPSQFKDLAASDSVRVQLGKDQQIIRGKSLGPLKRLAACIPSS